MSYSVNPTYPLLTVFSFLGFFFVLIPFPWHLQAWNAGTCVYMLWTAIPCLIQFINSIVWRNTALNVAPVWCDISTKILIGAAVGIPASAMCISRRLYKIAVIKTVSVTRHDKRRALIVDLCISIGIPVIVMALHYIVQGHRFDILEDVGCWPATYNTIPTYFLVYMWPALLGCISFVYSALTLRAFYKRRLEFNSIISSNTSLNANRYIRLMVLSVIEMACTVPITIYSIYISGTSVPIEPWISFSNTHHDFSYVGLVPAVEWTSNPIYKQSIEMNQWLFPACALLFFALFGFANEARKHYRLFFLWITKRFGYNPTTAQTLTPNASRWQGAIKYAGDNSVASLPVYIKRGSSLDSVLDIKKSFDVEKHVETSLQLPPYSTRQSDEDLSPTASPFSPFDIEAQAADVDLQTPSKVHSWYSLRERCTEHSAVPSYHRPFTPPSVYSVMSDEDKTMQSLTTAVAKSS